MNNNDDNKNETDNIIIKIDDYKDDRSSSMIVNYINGPLFILNSFSKKNKNVSILAIFETDIIQTHLHDLKKQKKSMCHSINSWICSCCMGINNDIKKSNVIFVVI
mmetsp:Transcript_17357/g.22533  ORF Transcript_17357/g.22533 Transcript_17357/m.22533 type:complete len:106 (+) Transcript_17357:444-761(+)